MARREVQHLLIGGGLASGNCARWLREEGADGDIVLVGRESDPPYNRPELSKGYLRGEETREEVQFRPREWWDEQRIELLLRTTVTALDLSTRTAQLSNNEEIGFEKALIATGANIRRLPVEGCELEKIHYLRSYGNSDAIRNDAEGAEQVVLVGGSFIGCEVAASLTKLGKRCTILMREQAPLELAFGAAFGGFVRDRLEAIGVGVHGGEELDRFEGDGSVSRVLAKSGRSFDADVVVVGAGVAPDVQLAQKAGLEIGPRGGILCSSGLESSVPGVFAAGDVCEYASVLHDGAHLRIEHWDVAFNHGKTAALNMLGRGVAHEEVPYFYSILAGLGELEYVGPAYEWDEEIVRGSFEEGSFTNWYLSGGRVRAALTWGRSEDLEVARRLLREPFVLDEADRRRLADVDSEIATLA